MMNHGVEGGLAGSNVTSDCKNAPGRKLAFDYLRAFGVLLVLFHHAVHAYILSASINFENPIATATPVVNEGRWPIFDLLVMYNETFLMPLLFFVSGLFVWGSLSRKGTREYLRNRLLRLGLPFAIGLLVLIPLAYYPAQLQVGQITGVESSYGRFWLDIVQSGFGTAGPLWFLWILLGFNCLAAILYRAVSDLGDLIRSRSAVILDTPGYFFGILIGVSIAVYLPLAVSIGPMQWIGIGSFQVQISRIGLYLVYFLAGTAVGAYGIDRTIFRFEGPLANRWWAWLVLGLVAYLAFVLLVVVINPLERTVLSETAFALCGGATFLGMTGFFLRFAKHRVSVVDRLSANSYGIYLVHYVFVTWLQYFLLGISLAPSLKGMVVFGGTWLLSWGTAAALRRLPAVAKVI